MKTKAAHALAHISPKASEGPGAGRANAPNGAALQADDLAQNSGSASALDLPDAPILPFGPQAQALLLPGSLVASPGIQLSALQLPVIAPPDIPKPRVGGQATEARILTQTPPQYPLAAKQAQVQGSVIVRAVIGVNGRVKLAKALSGPPLLQSPAVKAVRRWVYKPATLNGVAVESEMRIELKFALGR
jgi:TonB family protein